MAAALYALTLTPLARDHLWEPHLRLTARAAAAALTAFGQPAVATGRLISGETAAIEVRRGCDAIEPSELLWAATLAFPAAAGQRAIGLIGGTIVLQLLNVGRVAGLFAVRVHHPDAFDHFHVEIGQAGFVIVVVVVWLGWMEWVARARPRTAGGT
jgi:exosortase H (IPTLxxWG-CTERM-specific)